MIRRFAALALILVLAACTSAPTVKTDFDPKASFANYRTYSWMPTADGAASLLQQRIVDGIDSRLQARGWRLAPDGQVRVSAQVSSNERKTYNTFYSGIGYDLNWAGFGPNIPGSVTTSVDTYEVGTLVVDMFDTASKRAIWRSTATGVVPDDPSKLNALVQASLDKMFAGFPPGGAK